MQLFVIYLLKIIVICIIICFSIIGIGVLYVTFNFVKECFEENILLGIFSLAGALVFICLFLLYFIAKWLEARGG